MITYTLAMDGADLLRELLFSRLLIIGVVFVGLLVIILSLALVLRRPKR